MSIGAVIENGKYGPRAILRASYSERVLKYLKERDVRELELNSGKGWSGSSLEFLSELPNLRVLEVHDFALQSDRAIHALHKLRELHLFTYCSSELRFENFPFLEECSLEWRPNATSLFGCHGLKAFFVNSYKGRKDLDDFAALQNLERLGILNAPVLGITGIETLKKLQYLRMGNLKRLRRLRGLQELVHLEELNMNACMTGGAIEEVAALHKLRRLIMIDCDKIASLKPLLALPYLEEVIFPGSTNIVDGNLSVLTDLPCLRKVAFKNRRHYSHRREEFPGYRIGHGRQERALHSTRSDS